ncbi:hypothetical protein G7Y89_g13475 [Cudoniella acicularis]|uniref:Uncharacterized protein n=1 Tax=Cudoniella acicularis TaxID=354080 RepID=A0A8H4R986_9HELO|nr:hypothetical protein G7Y89_g13475 [Cudoniella acicularis]
MESALTSTQSQSSRDPSLDNMANPWNTANHLNMKINLSLIWDNSPPDSPKSGSTDSTHSHEKLAYHLFALQQSDFLPEPISTKPEFKIDLTQEPSLKRANETIFEMISHIMKSADVATHTDNLQYQVLPVADFDGVEDKFMEKIAHIFYMKISHQMAEIERTLGPTAFSDPSFQFMEFLDNWTKSITALKNNLDIIETTKTRILGKILSKTTNQKEKEDFKCGLRRLDTEMKQAVSDLKGKFQEMTTKMTWLYERLLRKAVKDLYGNTIPTEMRDAYDVLFESDGMLWDAWKFQEGERKGVLLEFSWLDGNGKNVSRIVVEQKLDERDRKIGRGMKNVFG